jgi:hypothetical protein
MEKPGFYKLQNEQDEVLQYAQNFVRTPSALLLIQNAIDGTYQYPVDGWTYYPSELDAYKAFNLSVPDSESLGLVEANNYHYQNRLQWETFIVLLDLPERGGNGIFQVILSNFLFGGNMFLIASNFAKGLGTENELRLLNSYVNMVFPFLSDEQKQSVEDAIRNTGVPIKLDS